MEATRTNYYALSYCVPFLGVVAVFGLLSCFNRRASNFIHRSILGVELDLPDTAKDSNVKAFFFVPIDDGGIARSPPLKCWMRIVGDLICSLILGIFIAILFQNLILGFQSVSEGDNCPLFQADCFTAGASNQKTNFTCEQGNKANFSSGNAVYYCFGFVYPTVSAKDIIDAVGICGGLMGVISSIVPLVFYLTRYKACLGLSFAYVLIPIAVIAIMIVIATASFIGPAGLSTLAWIIFVLLLLLTLTAWIWGFVRSWKNINKNARFIETCPFCCCFPKRQQGEQQVVINVREAGGAQSSSDKSFLFRQYFYYPLCCLGRCSTVKPFGKAHDV